MWILRFLALPLLAATVPAVAQSCDGPRPAGTVRLTVIATGVRSEAGEMVFTVYPDDSARFLAKGGKLARQRLTAASATRACFWLRPGYYALATYHDENGDHDFNRSLFAPKEGFGFSNDAPATFGLPKFSAARVLLPPTGAVLRIRTRYGR